jgi:hypothetical protein
MHLTGIPLDTIEDLVRQSCLKPPLYPRKLCDLSVMHPLEGTRDEPEVIQVGCEEGSLPSAFRNQKGGNYPTTATQKSSP